MGLVIRTARRLEAAGLLLLPQNAGASARLDLVRILLASGSVDPSRSLEELVRSEAVESLREAEDHPAQPFVDQVAFDRTLNVLPGPRDDSAFSVRILLHALFLVRPLPPKLRAELLELVGTALHAVDRVVRRAGLGPFVVPAPPGEIVIPEAAVLQRLAAAVVFDHGELAPLSTHADRYLKRLAATDLAPVESAGRRWIVTAPDLVMPALIEAVTVVFAERGMTEDLLERFDAAVFASVASSLARLGLGLIEPARDRAGEVGREALFQTDGGEVVLLQQIRSDMESRPERPVDDLPLRRVPALEPSWAVDGDATILSLGQPVADPYFAAAAKVGGPWSLAMSAADLEVMSYAFSGDDRLLPRFARAANQIRQDVEIVRYATLDEFWIWKENGESYWRPDADQAGVMMVNPGTALPLRMAVAVGRDLRAIAWPGGGTVEATRRYFGDAIPIYEPAPRPEFVSSAVTVGPSVAWILIAAPHGEALPERQWLVDARTLVDAAAFWLWQLSPHLAQRPGGDGDVLAFEVDLPPDGLRALFTDAERPGPVAVEYPFPMSVGLSFPGPIQEVGASNEGDAALARALLVGWNGTMGVGLNADDDIVAAVAPGGQKRRLVPIDLGWNSSIAQPDTPTLRRLSIADFEDWRIRAEPILRGLKPGVLDTLAQKETAFRDVVSGLFQELEQSIATFSGDLLPALVWQIEASYRTQAVARLEHPTDVACFGPQSHIAAHSLRDLLAADHPSPAVRFLIEYTAAKPPSGSTPPSTARLDSLIALAGLIIELGMASDGIRFVDPGASVSINGRGRLVYDTKIAEAMAEFGAQVSRQSVYGALDAFGMHWAPKVEDEPISDIWFEGNAAFQAEFGYTLTELAELVNSAILIADDRDASVNRIHRQTFVDELSRRLGWPASRVSAVLDGLTLEPRTSFLSPKAPAEPRDTFPWRHNRPLSYLRRPFAQVGSGNGRSILYGTRHLAVAPRYLFALVASGRLSAATPAMRQLEGKLAGAQARQFVEEVARRCRAAGLEARINVRKIGNVRIAGQAGDLGDIDVLAIDRARALVWLLECKSSQAARTPWELHSEIREFLDPGGFVDKHVKRREWLEAHRGLAAEALGLGPAFDIRAAMVAPLPLLAGLLHGSDVPIVDPESLSRLITPTDGATAERDR